MEIGVDDEFVVAVDSDEADDSFLLLAFFSF